MKGTSVLLLVAFAVGARTENPCPQEQEINWEIEMLFPHKNCHWFYKCTFGKPIPYECPANLYFNDKTWQCDWPHNVECGDRIDPTSTTAQPTTTTQPPTTTTTTQPPTTTTTTQLPTTTTTTQPPTTTTTTTTTPPPTTTTTTTTTPPPTTTTTTTTTPPPTTTTTTTTTQPPTQPPTSTPEIDFLENGCPVNPHIHWLLPHERDCNLFYYCVWGQLVLRQCPASLHFNPVLQVCDWPWDAGCRVSANKHIRGRSYMSSDVDVSVRL